MKVTNPVIVHEWPKVGGGRYAIAVADVEEVRVATTSVFSFWSFGSDDDASSQAPTATEKRRHEAVLLVASKDVMGNDVWSIAVADEKLFKEILQQLAMVAVGRQVRKLLAPKEAA